MRGKRIKSLASDLVVPVVVGIGVVVLGVIIGRIADWGPGAYWGLAIIATAIAFAIFARQDLTRLSKSNRS